MATHWSPLVGGAAENGSLVHPGQPRKNIEDVKKMVSCFRKHYSSM